MKEMEARLQRLESGFHAGIPFFQGALACWFSTSNAGKPVQTQAHGPAREIGQRARLRQRDRVSAVDYVSR